MRALLLHNPTSGTGRHSAKALLAALSKAGLAPEYVPSNDPDIQRRLGEPTDVVIAAGGDGTVAKAMDLSHPDTLIAILPMGTANNIARSLGITGKSVAKHLAGWRTARPRAFDIGEVRGPIKRRSFVEAVGFGALAKALDKGEKAEKRTGNGIDAGMEALRKAFIEDDPEHLSVTLDNHKLKGDFFLVEVLNIPFAGPGLPLAPWAHSGDGLLDVAAVEKNRRKEMLAWLDHPERSIPPVTMRQARKVSLTWKGGPFRVDDHFYRDTVREGTVTIKLKKDGVRVLIPHANGRAT